MIAGDVRITIPLSGELLDYYLERSAESGMSLEELIELDILGLMMDSLDAEGYCEVPLGNKDFEQFVEGGDEL